jgi:hypothetical protein
MSGSPQSISCTLSSCCRLWHMAHTGVERRGCVEKTQSFTNVSGSKTTICVTTEEGVVIRRVVYCRDCSGGGTTSRRRRGSGGGYAVLYQSAQGARRPPGGGSSTSMTYRRRTTSTSFLVNLVAYLQCVYPLSREVVVLLCPDLWYQKHLLPWWRSSYRLVTYSSSYLNIYFLGIVLHSGK